MSASVVICQPLDVSKDRLDVAVRPTGEGCVFKRTAAGIEDLVAGLKTLSPALVAIEATGGFETVVAVRRQSVWDNGLGKLREALAHRCGAVRRPAGGAA